MSTYFDIENVQSVIDIDEDKLNLIRHAANATILKTAFEYDVAIDFTLTDNTEIQEINLAQRGNNVPTDVLSFPYIEYSAPLKFEYNKMDLNEVGALMLGAIVISLVKVNEQAMEYAHSFERELGFVTVHGVLHLLGFDHQTTGQESIMFGLQEEILNDIGLFR